MTTIYTVLEVSALLIVIILPLAGPKKKKETKTTSVELSDLAVNENGYLESLSEKDHSDHFPVKIK
jgi:hypothetical protein